MIIYKALNKINSKCYIGQTVNSLDKRIRNHIYCAYKRLKSPLHSAIKKYGIQSFEWSVIDSTLIKEVLNEKEKYWINFYGCKSPNGYNLTEGGDGNSGYSLSEESKEKIRKGVTGFKHSEETKRKMSIGKKCKLRSPEHEKKLNLAKIGRFISEETKRKIGIANKGKHSDPRPEEIKKKISESHKGMKKPWVTKRNLERGKKII